MLILNCRVIRDSIKRADILDKARSRNSNIICLQETHIIGSDLNLLRKEWNVKYFISGNKRNARGVMVIFDNNVEYIIRNAQFDREVRYIILEIEIPQVVTFLLINVYVPNDEKVKFTEKLFNIIDSFENNNIIIVGDWNSVLDPEMDTKFYTNTQKSKMTKELSNYMRRKGLLDIWRMNHPQLKKFTWARRNPTKLGHLDYFLMSDTLLPLYADSYIKPSYKSDHSPIGLDIYIQKKSERSRILEN